MPHYRFRIGNDTQEDHDMNLPDDATAVAEGVRTAAGLLEEVAQPGIGTSLRRVEVLEGDGAPVLEIEIRTVRRR